EVKNHQATSNEDELQRRIMCPLCESKFNVLRELVAHSREMHASDKNKFAIHNECLSGAEFKKWMSTKRCSLIGPVVLMNRQADVTDYRCSLQI
uniref:Chromo domain-containing protein n=1 Tax=Parascaris univalens TaxID=6257 RepID=A0A915CGG5_PARUN